ncbi:ribonuclease Z [Clostridium cavendishii DSM 21758]|uniref:Ribonuclease Z n=1 Tax=Clostridium cavendishii DSM 21758 TaxID=1121302 RepID=A0A1M6EIY7_9CLOT|nr:MBL fold metallo-hydrolase [Clostridium cavendishii]SHI85411.1 ribonuclease Z [Clostridium cavendishii DSM 21758]
MTKINFLGTGNAMVTKCYNTCFTIENEYGEHLLIDTGGGNSILTQLENLNISISKIHNLFLSHSHNDHINGITFIIRAVVEAILKDQYKGTLNIYGHKTVLDVAKALCHLLLEEKFTNLFDDKILFIEISDNNDIEILNYKISFFNIDSTKRLQFGFKLMTNDNISLAFIGDEPYKAYLFKYCNNSDYLIHEAYCLYEEREIFKPYEKSHTTVKEACENATELNVDNIILLHTEDKHIENRKEFYSAEGRYFFNKNIIVPDDLETLELTNESSKIL